MEISKQMRYCANNVSRHDQEERIWFLEWAKAMESLEAERDKYKTALEQIKHIGDVQIRPPNYAGHEHLDKECGHIACVVARALKTSD